MKKLSFEELCFKIYRSAKPSLLKSVIPLIDFTRKLNNKPPIPIKEKFAQINYPKLSNKVIMLHGVSVGEVLSLENLVKEIKTNFPDYDLVLTTGTLTGQELAHKKYSEYASFITYFPLDTYETVETFLDKISPSVILIAETELWPNFAYCAKQKNIPLYIINGRISDKSYPSYSKIKNFIKLIFENYSGIFCQSELDKERFISLGANPNTTEVMKNLKFEVKRKECDIDLKKENSKLLIAGSTHPTEEEVVLETYKNLKKEIKDLKLLLAPRHLTRLDDVIKIVQETNIKFGFRTKNDDFTNNDIIILDTLGELSKAYALADIVFIGGSFNSTGGHNPLEAVIYSKPTISGPSIKNFRDIYSILSNDKASFVVKNQREFENIAKKLLTDTSFYNETSQNCLKCFNYQQGALDFVINKLRKTLVKCGTIKEDIKNGDNIMKIAIPTAEGKLCSHFGHCETFSFAQVNPETKEIIDISTNAPEEGVSCQSANWLASQGTNLVLAGGMGGRPMMALEQNGIKVITGCPELEVKEIVEKYLNDNLQTSENSCGHDEGHQCHGHHGEGHHCKGHHH